MYSDYSALALVPELPGLHAHLPTRLVLAAAAQPFSTKQSF
jgi:hypothetical protein